MKKIILKNKLTNELLELEGTISVIPDGWELIEEKKVKNGSSKKNANGDGSFYFSETLQKWIGQYGRKTITQRNGETKTQCKERWEKLKEEIKNGTYLEKRTDTVKYIIENHIEQKFKDGTIKGVSRKRNLETLSQLESCCNNFINNPIQKVTFYDIQIAKEKMKYLYSQSCINKMWGLLNKAFAFASSPSVKLITVNIMKDENLKKPISEKKTKKVYPLTKEERKKLEYVLNGPERNHKYRNIVKFEWITAMRIGEALARSTEDISKDKSNLHIHNTLTEDDDGNVIIGEHTKTYDKENDIDLGERYFPIEGELAEIINEQLNSKLLNIYHLLFWDYKKNTFISDSAINSWLDRINKKYKISSKKIHNHRLRHDCLTHWKENGVDMAAIQYLAGHVEGSNITDSVYIDVSKDFAFDEYKKVN